MASSQGKRADREPRKAPKEFFENERAILPPIEWKLRGRWSSMDDHDRAQQDRVDSLVAEGTRALMASTLTREELAAACARAEVHGAIAVDELRNGRLIFGAMMSDFTGTLSALRETGDIEAAKVRLSEAKQTFAFDKVLGLAAAASASAAARKAALAKHAKPSAKSRAKQAAFELFQTWEQHPLQYPSVAAFARSVLDKYPDELTSQPVIEGWVRQWRKPD